VTQVNVGQTAAVVLERGTPSVRVSQNAAVVLERGIPAIRVGQVALLVLRSSAAGSRSRPWAQVFT
jgi:hypothetical protein